jgi:hypothetical protein
VIQQHLVAKDLGGARAERGRGQLARAQQPEHALGLQRPTQRFEDLDTLDLGEGVQVDQQGRQASRAQGQRLRLRHHRGLCSGTGRGRARDRQELHPGASK